MYSIISSVPIEILQGYAVPLNPATKTPDLQYFFSTNEGKEFVGISPLSMKHVSNKEELKKAMLDEIFSISSTYNSELYVYILKDSAYDRLFCWQLPYYSNVKNCDKSKKMLPPNERYYFGEKSAIEDAINRKFPKTLKGKTMWEFLLNKDGLTEKYSE